MTGDVELRELVPRVLSVLVRRGADFATAEDAVQEALIRAMSAWNEAPPTDPTGSLVTVAWRAFLDMTRSDTARRDRVRQRGPGHVGHRAPRHSPGRADARGRAQQDPEQRGPRSRSACGRLGGATETVRTCHRIIDSQRYLLE